MPGTEEGLKNVGVPSLPKVSKILSKINPEAKLWVRRGVAFCPQRCCCKPGLRVYDVCYIKRLPAAVTFKMHLPPASGRPLGSFCPGDDQKGLSYMQEQQMSTCNVLKVTEIIKSVPGLDPLTSKTRKLQRPGDRALPPQHGRLFPESDTTPVFFLLSVLSKSLSRAPCEGLIQSEGEKAENVHFPTGSSDGCTLQIMVPRPGR